MSLVAGEGGPPVADGELRGYREVGGCSEPVWGKMLLDDKRVGGPCEAGDRKSAPRQKYRHQNPTPIHVTDGNAKLGGCQ